MKGLPTPEKPDNSAEASDVEFALLKLNARLVHELDGLRLVRESSDRHWEEDLEPCGEERHFVTAPVRSSLTEMPAFALGACWPVAEVTSNTYELGWPALCALESRIFSGSDSEHKRRWMLWGNLHFLVVRGRCNLYSAATAMMKNMAGIVSTVCAA